MATFLSSNNEDRPPYPVSTLPAPVYPGFEPGQTVNCNIHQALDHLPPEHIVSLIKGHPDVINERGFSGLYPLHRAALRGEIKIIEALLAAGADVNTRNDFEETPLHFACKRGHPQIMHLILESGADISAGDKLGKTAMHHATEGGSVYGIHYLVEVRGLTTHVLDKNLHTPLHIACARGHVEAFKYLIRKERSDFYQRDIFGNNALHLAAQFGHQLTCWKLLELTGVKLLHETNKEGYTPLDLAKQGKDYKSKKSVLLLEHYSNIQDPSFRARGPVFSWYSLLAMTFLWYGATIAGAQLFQRKGWFTLVGVIGFVISGLQQSHRMVHISGWPNPFYAGLFAAGLIYSTASYFINILPYIYSDYFITAVLSVILTPVGLYTYFVLLVRDPGVQKHSAEKDGIGGYYGMRDIAQGKVRMEAFCLHCEIVPPLKTRHCKLCDACYYEHDHHCLFMHRCVAQKNRWLYVMLQLFTLGGCLGYEVTAPICISYLYPDDTFGRDLISKVFHKHCWLWSFMLIDAFTIYQTISILQEQFENISKGLNVSLQPFGGKTNLSFKQRSTNLNKFIFLKKKPIPNPNVNYPVLFDTPEINEAFDFNAVHDIFDEQRSHATELMKHQPWLA